MSDFSVDGRYLIATCEFSGELHQGRCATQQKVLGHLGLTPRGMPQDVKLSPDGKVFYVANMDANGVHVVDGEQLQADRLHPHRQGRARALCQPRFASACTSRTAGEGSVSADRFRHAQDGRRNGPSRAAAARIWAASQRTARCSGWRGGTTARCYAFDTSNGHLLARIPVGKGPHGLCVYPTARPLFAGPHRQHAIRAACNKGPCDKG